MVSNSMGILYSMGECLFTDMDSLFYILVACICMDYLSGILHAIVHKELSSKVGAKGICRKILIFIIVGLSRMLDRLIIGDEAALQTAITLFYIANEGISILENAAGIGLPIPKILEDTIYDLRQDVHNKK